MVIMDIVQNSEKKFYKRLISITLPVAFQSLMLSLVAACDALMLGSLSQNSMSAVSLATQVQFVENMLFFSIVGVEVILGSQYYGKKDMDSLNKIFCITLKINIVVSFLFFLASILSPRFLMLIFTDQEELIEKGVEYLKIAGWSYLITGISQTYLTMFKVTDHAFRAAVISTVTVLLNIILNAVFIYGLFGIPSLDVKGAAFATLIARVVELSWAVLNSYRKNYIYPRIKNLIALCKNLLFDFFKLLIPLLLGSSLLWGIGFTSYTAFLGHLGTDAAAANSVAAVVRDLLCCLCSGLSNAALIIIGNELGRGNLDGGKLYGKRILKIALISSLAVTLLVFSFTPLVMHFVKLSQQANVYLLQMLIVTAVYMYGRSLNTIVINGIFQSGGDTLYDLYSLFVTMWCLAIPLAFCGTFVFHWPVIVVYACTCIDEVGKIPWVLHHFYKYKWVKDLTR